jgi:dCTP deaminase
VLSAAHIADLLADRDADDPLVITPMLDLDELRTSGAASVDLRLGTWFAALRATRTTALDVVQAHVADAHMAKMSYVPFGKAFVLHPGSFVLAVTLEWIRLPHSLSGDVVGKSAWGRHGLSIATATGVHPTFTGCLTLELSNVGDIPIKLYPATRICQLFLHQVTQVDAKTELSGFVGQRRPVLGVIRLDEIARKLTQPR